MRLRTVIAAMMTSVVLLSAGNVLLLLQSRDNTGLSTLSQAAPIHRYPLAGLVNSFWRWMARDDMMFTDSRLGPFIHGLETCPDASRPLATDILWVESDWQMTQVRNDKRDVIYIYSAHYDDRLAAGFLPSIRVLVLSTLRRDATVYCAVWLPSVDRPYIVQAIVNSEAGSGYVFDRRNHREYAYICQLPANDPVPSAVSIVSGGTDPCLPVGLTYTTLVPISRTARNDRPSIEFGVCVTAGYGYISPQVFVEWIELNRMFGAEEIHLYNTWYDGNMSTSFGYYTQRGVLHVHSLRHPKHADNSWFFNKVRNLRITALNDCQLRNMYRYRYIIVIDTDEIIIPRTTSNYSSLISELDRQRNVPGVPAFAYVFLNIYFLLDFEPDTTRPDYLRTIQYRYRVRPKSYGYAPKSMVDPRQCSVAFNHYCARYLIRPASPKLKRSYRVPFTTASSHHYRQCGHFYAYTCDQLFAEKTRDDFMLTFERQIGARVSRVLTDLGLR